MWLPCPGHSGPYFEGRVEIQEDVEYTAGGRGYREHRRGLAGRRASRALAFLCENSTGSNTARQTEQGSSICT